MARGVVRGIALFAVASEIVNAQTPVPTSACNWAAPGVGTSFDLTGAKLPNGQSYTVTDVRQPKTTYSFNVCDNVAPPSTSVCTQKLPCWNCPARPLNALPAAGWQMQGNGSICYRLGTTGGTNWTYQLQGEWLEVLTCTHCSATFTAPTADVNYPNKGVTIVYTGGDNTFCPNNGMRSLWLQFLCHPTSSTPQKTLSTTVIGRNECNYGIGVRAPVASVHMPCCTCPAARADPLHRRLPVRVPHGRDEPVQQQRRLRLQRRQAAVAVLLLLGLLGLYVRRRGAAAACSLCRGHHPDSRDDSARSRRRPRRLHVPQAPQADRGPRRVRPAPRPM